MEIKDSGERTEFDTGAVRDMHGGKGRMDLLPWEAIMELSKHCENGATKYGEHNVDKGITDLILFEKKEEKPKILLELQFYQILKKKAA